MEGRERGDGSGGERPTVFISYSRRDEAWKKRLVRQLEALELQGLLDMWDESHTPLGAHSTRVLKAALDRARVAILLITADYLVSDSIRRKELPRLLARRRDEGLRIIPVLVGACPWQNVEWLKPLQVYPRERDKDDMIRPLAAWEDHEIEAHLVAIAREAYALLDVDRNDGDDSEEVPFNPAPKEVRAPASLEVPLANDAEPEFPDENARQLSEALEDARRRKRALQEAGEDTTPVDREIKERTRELREGGQLRAGDSLGNGRYHLLAKVGKGGFATVWRARDRETNELVAVKVLHVELAGDWVRRERFLRGARRMVDLAGEGIVPIRDPHGEDGGYHYIVMDLLPKGDFRQAIIKKGIQGQDVLPLILKVGAALARAHARGLAHRDIKPSNILLDAAYEPYLADFDLVAEGADSTGGTRTSAALGTMVYAAPELLLNAEAAGPRADVFGLAMTAVFGLYGDELRVLVTVGAKKIIEGLSCSAKVKAVLLRGVAIDEKARHADATAFCDALREAMKASKPAARPGSNAALRTKRARYNVATVGLLTCFVLAVLMLGRFSPSCADQAKLETAALQGTRSVSLAITDKLLEAPPITSPSTQPAPEPAVTSVPSASASVAEVLGSKTSPGKAECRERNQRCNPTFECCFPGVCIDEKCWTPDDTNLSGPCKDSRDCRFLEKNRYNYICHNRKCISTDRTQN